MKLPRLTLKPGQESVWDYPRPPVIVPTSKLVEVIFAGVVVASSRQALRVLETSHPPTYYLPPEDVRADLLEAATGTSACEFKGAARYWDLRAGGRESRRAAWSYPRPRKGFAALRDHLAFYPSRVDRCLVAGEAALPQPGDFYGGWITSDVVGPFKGAEGTWGW